MRKYIIIALGLSAFLLWSSAIQNNLPINLVGLLEQLGEPKPDHFREIDQTKVQQGYELVHLG